MLPPEAEAAPHVQPWSDMLVLLAEQARSPTSKTKRVHCQWANRKAENLNYNDFLKNPPSINVVVFLAHFKFVGNDPLQSQSLSLTGLSQHQLNNACGFHFLARASHHQLNIKVELSKLMSTEFSTACSGFFVNLVWMGLAASTTLCCSKLPN